MAVSVQHTARRHWVGRYPWDPSSALAGAPSPQDSGEGTHHYVGIEPEGPVAYVERIDLFLLLQIGVAAFGHLP